LLGVTSAEVQADRLGALNELRRVFGGTILLKGAGTLISTSGVPWLIRAGNPGMATAGMGDVLTGVSAALLAQNQAALKHADELSAIAATAAWAHASAADRLAEAEGERGLLASDLFAQLRTVLNP
jgi:NAD(P)H-hydrate epimerase